MDRINAFFAGTSFGILVAVGIIYLAKWFLDADRGD